VSTGRDALDSVAAHRAGQPVSEADERFIRAAAELVAEEIRIAELGSRRGTRPEIRGFAEKLASEHQAARNEIELLATKKGVLLPTGDSRSSEADRVAGSSGEMFDENFAQWAKARQSGAIKLFEQAADECTDGDVRQFAERMLPRLQAQHAHARRLQRALY
jgi:putative membrane protein